MTALALTVYLNGYSSPSGDAKLSFNNVAASFLLLPQQGVALVNVSWVLKYEALFYLLFALLIFKPSLGLCIFVCWQLMILLNSVFPISADHTVIAFYLKPICLEFGIGLIIAQMLRAGWFAGQVAAPTLFSVGILAFSAGVVVEGAQANPFPEIASALLFGTSAGAIILSLCHLEGMNRFRIWSPINYLGEASYSVYLVHFSVLTIGVIVLERLDLPQGILPAAALLAIAVVAGVMFHAMVDKPLQRRLAVLRTRVLEATSPSNPTGASSAALGLATSPASQRSGHN